MPEVRVVSSFENEGRRKKVIFSFLTANPEKSDRILFFYFPPFSMQKGYAFG